VWSYENLDHFLLTPKGFAPGTKMTFAGVKNDQERANIIAFLSTLSASPKPFPPADAPAGAETATDEQTVDGTVSTAPEAVEETPDTMEEPSAEPAPAASEAPAASSEAPAASSEAPVSAEASSAAQ